MLKCSQCGADVELGSKFCAECGNSIPQIKECPTCHSQWPLKVKFCAECGYSFISADKCCLMGDKNVIAGDVINNVTNTTVIEGESGHLVECVVCGRAVKITEAYTCSKCGEYICSEHFDSERALCKNCIDVIENEYKTKLKFALADGIIDHDEFEQLESIRKRLGIPAQRAMELQKKMKVEMMDGKMSLKSDVPLTVVEQSQCERVKDLLYEKGDSKKAYELIRSICQKHPLNEEVLQIYIPSLMEVDEDECRDFIGSLPVDLECAHLALVDIELRNGDIAAADAKLTLVERLWPNSISVKLRRVACMFAIAIQNNDKGCLGKAIDILNSLSGSMSKLARSWHLFFQYAISEFLGDEVPCLTEEFCQEESVYFSFMRGISIGFPKLERCRVAAESGDAVSQTRLGMMYYEGKGVGKDRVEALRWYTKAAEQGDADAQYSLGCMYKNAEGTRRDYASAEKWFRKAAERGNADAQYNLGCIYKNREGDSRENESEAVNWFRKAAKQGHVDAKQELGIR